MSQTVSVRGRGAPTRVLVLGGSSEATALVVLLASRPEVHTILSLAGRTAAPAAYPVATRIGGFGGVEGLVAYLRAEAIDVLVDATHPFAAQMSRHAREAAARTTCHIIELTRPAWTAQHGDRWTNVTSMAQAASAIGPAPRRVFLTVGRLQLAHFSVAAQHHYLVRTIDPVGADHNLAGANFITARGPFDAEAEHRLLRDHQIEIVVTKNSGGGAAAGKLAAARLLRLPVIMVDRPDAPNGAWWTPEAVAKAIITHNASDRLGV